MARRSKTPASHALFDVIYEDGTRRSNRRVAIGEMHSLDDPIKFAEAALEQQDREIAEKSGSPAPRIKSVKPSGGK